MNKLLRKLTAVVSAAAVVTVGGIVGLSALADGVQTTLDIGRGSISITADSVSGFDISGNAVTATDPDGYIITGSTKSNKVTVSGTQNITLKDATIDLSGNNYYCAFDICDSGDVTLTLEGVNTIKSGANCAGIDVCNNEKLEITGEGSLTVTGGQYGAGIGTGMNSDGDFSSCGSVVISGGSVWATGGELGASVGDGASFYSDEGGTGYSEGNIYPPKDKNDNELYPCTIDNPDSETITIDGVEFLPKIHSDSEKAAHAFLTKDTHYIKVGEKLYSTTPHYYDYTLDYLEVNEVTVGSAFSITASDGGEALVYGRDYTYPADTGVLTVLSDKAITISSASQTDNTIVVAKDISANITLNGVNIDVSATSRKAAFEIAKDSAGNVIVTVEDDNTLKSGEFCAGLQKVGENGTLTITGTGMLTAEGGNSGAGIGGGHSGKGSNITISGGTVNANGGDNGAGVGGGNNYGSGSNITISGGVVTATGGSQGAGIGGGNEGSGSYITISGGTVTANGGSGGAGIGGGMNGSGSYITITGGSVYAKGATWSNYCGADIGSGTIRYGLDYKNGDAVTPTNGTDNVYLIELDSANTSLTIDGKSYPINHGEDGKVYAYLTEGDHTVIADDETTTYRYLLNADNEFVAVGTAFTITADSGSLVYGEDYTYPASTGVLTIKSDTAVTIANADPTAATTDTIVVAADIGANITLAGVNIDVSSLSDTAAFKIADDSTGNVTITLADGSVNTLKSGYYCAGLQKNGDTVTGTLTIQGGANGTGTLTATSGARGAGIGGGQSGNGSNIKITGGTVTATGGAEGAGIGGGSNGYCSNIKITGGTVEATGGASGAGIGGGYYGYGSYIEITDGTVTAAGGDFGAGIGGGYYGYCSNIKITGGTVEATGGASGAGIGGGQNGYGSNIKITGGTVTANGGSESAGIGGATAYGSDITISDGTVTATGGAQGAGIGGGRCGKGSNITINGGNVTANGGSESAGIGGGNGSEPGSDGSGSDITISGGVVTATGGTQGSGIGGGFGCDGSNIKISGGTVIATGTNGAGIGGGSNGSGSNIKISGGTVIATGKMGAGIGGGNLGYGTNITISGGTVTAIGKPNSNGDGGAGIGGGFYETGSNITITGGSVKAVTFAVTGGYDIGGYESAVTPTLADGTTSVYLLTIANPTGAKVTIDGTEYAYANHSAADANDTNLYAYLTGADHTVTIGGATTHYKFYTDKFLPVPKASDFTFTAPTDLKYTGTAKVASVTSDKSGMGEITPKYYGAGGTEVTQGADFAPGTYTVKINVAKGDNFAEATDITSDGWTFTITAGDLTANNFDFTAPSSLVYDGNAKTATVTAKNGITGTGEITVKYQKEGEEATTEAPKTPGTYKVSIDIAAGSNYKAVTGLTADDWKFTITKATPNVTAPTATEITYGEALSASTLSDANWKWVNGTDIPTVSNSGYSAKIDVDDGNYNYTGIEGYDSVAHTVTRTISVTVNPVTPKITITATPSYAITGKETTVMVTAEVKNPNNGSLNDLPATSLSYKIGDGAEQAITDGSFVIPNDTPDGTTYTIIARTSVTVNYNAGTDATTVVVTDCTHANVPAAWKTDATHHWHECPDCGAELDKAEHIEDSGTVTTEPTATTEGIRTYKCVECKYVIRTETIPATGGRPTKPTYPIYPVIPTTPTPPTTPTTPKEPEIKGENGKSGWEAIVEEIKDIEEGDKAVIDMNGATMLPKNILEAIEGKDIDIVLEMGNGITWTINGQDIENPEAIDLNVSNISKIPAKVINKVTGEKSYVALSIRHDGDFGFTATLTIDLGKKNKNLYANLYYYNTKTKKTEFVGSCKIDKNGDADFLFTHASDYIIIIDKANHAKPQPKATSTKDSITLRWKAVPGAEKYGVYKYVNGKAVKVKETKKLGFKFTKLKPGKKYSYIVRAYVDGKWTTMKKSDIVSATTKKK